MWRADEILAKIDKILPEIGLILKFKKAADISKTIKDYEATPFTFR